MQIETLEDYLIALGLIGAQLQVLQELQKRVLRIGILLDDEAEQVETIDYQIKKICASIESQLRLVSERNPDGWKETLEKIKGKLKDEKSGTQ